MTVTPDPRLKLAQEALEQWVPSLLERGLPGAASAATALAQALIEVLGEKDEEIVNLRFAAENAHREHEELRAEVERLRRALDRAGDRLASVQPAVTEPWAYEGKPDAQLLGIEGADNA